MIQSNELRQGNLIIGTYEKEEDNLMHETICEFKFYNCYDNYYFVESKDGIEDFSGFKPIPLTEEFKKDFGENELVLVDKLGFVIFKKGYAYQFVFEDFPYIHLIQNLYFALTNNELEITL